MYVRIKEHMEPSELNTKKNQIKSIKCFTTAVIDGQLAYAGYVAGKSIDEMLLNKTLDLIDSHRLEIGVKWAHKYTLPVTVEN